MSLQETSESILCILTAAEFLQERMGASYNWVDVNQTAFGSEFLAFCGDPIFAATVSSHLGRFLRWVRRVDTRRLVAREAELPLVSAPLVPAPLVNAPEVPSPRRLYALGDLTGLATR